jgi:hypothetical protein
VSHNLLLSEKLNDHQLVSYYRTPKIKPVKRVFGVVAGMACCLRGGISLICQMYSFRGGIQ